MPLLRTAMYAKGIQLYCAPTADDRDTWISTMQHVALEGRCFVLSCCQFARRSDFPAGYETPYGDDPNTVICRGGSCIVSPLGRILAGPDFEGECIHSAELQMDRSLVASTTSTWSGTTRGPTCSGSTSMSGRCLPSLG